MSRDLVILDHDGGVDDYLATMLLLSYPQFETLGIVVTPGDCYINAAVSATRKLLDLMGQNHVPAARSTVRGLNAFPRVWRQAAINVDHLPALQPPGELATGLLTEAGQAFLVRQLRAAPRPVTLLVTGPLTTVAAALDLDPAVEHKISRLLWMGGALEAAGNVVDSEHDGSAEWNVYWDPPAAERIWRTDVPIVLCPLDVTNQVPVTTGFIRRLAAQRHFPLSNLAAQCNALIAHQGCYFWDVLTVAYLGQPDLFTVREYETAVVTEGLSQGRTVVRPGGRRVQVLDGVDVEAFYAHLLEQWAA